MAASEFLGGVKNFVYGVGEYARRTNPQYAMADQRRQELEFLQDEHRQKQLDERQRMMALDFISVGKMLEMGKPDLAIKRLEDRKSVV
jgi:hypothetical protein